VPGRASVNVKHGGEQLKPNSTYYWKVRIWDVDNRLSDYSEVQVFKTGVPNGMITSNEIFEVDTLAPQTLSKTSSDSYFIDFGKAAFASLELNYTSQRNDTLVFHIGEQLENGRVNRDPPGNIKYQRVNMPVSPGSRTYRLHITADERNTKPGAVALPDSFPVVMPFRYCEIENVQEEIDSDDIRQLACYAYFEEDQSSFNSPDTVLNQVWELCKYSVKATSFAGIYVDGERERIPYEADAYLNQLSHYNTDRAYAVARRTIEYFMQHPTWPTEWQLHVALMFYQDYMYTGNTELIDKYYEQLKFKTLEGLARQDGLISSQSDKLTPEFMAELGFKDPDARLRDIVDWPPAQKDTGWKLATKEGERDGYVFMPINTVINALFYKNMEVMALFADITGKPEEALDFQLKAIKVKKAVNEKLFNKKIGAYVDGEGTEHASLHANMFALAFGLVPQEDMPSVVDFMKTRGMACSVYGAQYLMEALYQAEASEYALELLTATHDRSWYNMIRVGSTITLEAWDMKYKPNADWNHAWGAVPANIIPRGLWGIEPKTPGYGIAKIKPQLADLPESSIVVPTIRGQVKAAFVKINNRLSQYTIELPGNMVGELTLSGADETDVTLNGQKVLTDFGTIRLEPGINVIQLSINSF
jgi:alpha-L-rhamnosidase